MTNYTFTCPLAGCGVVMKASSDTKEEAADSLVSQAKAHLASIHPDSKKTDDEVSMDIHAHMIVVE